MLLRIFGGKFEIGKLGGRLGEFSKAIGLFILFMELLNGLFMLLMGLFIGFMLFIGLFMLFIVFIGLFIGLLIGLFMLLGLELVWEGPIGLGAFGF